MDATKELEKAYRALQAFYRLSIRNERPGQAMLAYHSPTVAAALRFVEEEALDGSEYFVGKHIDVMHEYLRRAEPQRDQAGE